MLPPGDTDPMSERAQVAARLERARPSLERDLEALSTAHDRLGAARDLFSRLGFELSGGGPRQPVFARCPGPPGGARILVHHRIWARPGPVIRSGDSYAGPDVVRGLGPMLAALYGIEPQGADLWFGLSWPGAELSAAGAKVPPLDGVILGAGTWPGGRPAVVGGARGRLGLRLNLATAQRPCAADRVVGAARNPLAELAALSSELAGAAHLFLEAQPMRVAEAQHFALSGFDLDAFADREGLRVRRHDDALDAMEALWTRPAVELLCLLGDGDADRVSSEAEARLAVYLVPDLDPGAVMERVAAFVAKAAPDVCLQLTDDTPPWTSGLAKPAEEAVRDAYRRAFGARGVIVRQAEPLPEAARFAEVAPVVCAATARPDLGPDTPGERLPWSHLVGAATLYAQLVSACDDVFGRRR